MATSQTAHISGVATLRDIDESQELQDRGIRKEFQSMRTYVDKRFEEQRSYMDDRFQQVDDRFQQVDDRLQQIDKKFQDLEVLMKNSRATSSWQIILPVREPRNQYQTPPVFPNRIIKFWRLQRPRKQPQLVELLRFYHIRASDLTSPILEDNDDTESESSFESQSTLERTSLEEAVKANPALALAHLAARLGLDYGSISHNMGLYEQIQAVKTQQETQRTKREKSDDKSDARPSKKAAISEVIQAHRSGTGIPIEVLVAYPDEFPYESPLDQSHVSWAPRPKGDSLPSRASTLSSKKTTTPPSQSSHPSKATIPFTQTPSVMKGAGKGAGKDAGKSSGKTTSSKHSQTSEETSF